MKKKAIIWLLGIMMAMTAVGCGDNKKDSAVDGTEAIEGTESAGTVKSASGAFDLKASDYVKFCDYDAIPITITGTYKVEDDNVTEYFEQMFTQYGPFYMEDTAKKTVAEGDIVNVDYVGKVDGVAFDNGSAEGQLIDVYKNASADGSGFIEGFADGLKGAAVGDVLDWDVTFPEDYGNADLAGKDAVFTFTVNSIQKERTIEDIDDEFAKEQFQVETVDDMYAQVREYLENSAAYARQKDIYDAIQNYLLDNCEVEVPEDYLAARVADYRSQVIRANCDGDETQLESYLSTYYGKTVEEAEAEWKEGIEQNVRLEMILETIAEKEGVKLDEDEFKQYVSTMVSSSGYESEAAMYELYGYGDAAYGEKYVRQIFMDEQALRKLMDNAKVTEEPAASEETEGTEGTENIEGTENPEDTENPKQ